MIRKFHEIRENSERGFTLIELLVVMIIIGILAAVAIPIFMNQQRTSRDTATVADVKNLATNVQSMLVRNPDATVIGLGAASSTDPTYTLTVGTGANAETTTISKTSGTRLVLYVGDQPGTFVIGGWNPSGKKYIGKNGTGLYPSSKSDLLTTSKDLFLVYDSNDGGLKR